MSSCIRTGATAFTDSARWSTEVARGIGGAITQEAFAQNISKAQSIRFASGIVSTNSNPPNVLLAENAVVNGVYRNAVGSNASSASASITWQFPQPIRAFSAHFSQVADGGLTLSSPDITGVSWMVYRQIGGADGFFGFVGHGLLASCTDSAVMGCLSLQRLEFVAHIYLPAM